MKLLFISHGGSDGLHAYVHSLDYAVSDLKIFIEKVVTENPGLPCFCYGHSTGAAITLRHYLIQRLKSASLELFSQHLLLGLSLLILFCW